jgi:hypothetical protein
MSRGVVLGGGGIAGVAWEAGLTQAMSYSQPAHTIWQPA